MTENSTIVLLTKLAEKHDLSIDSVVEKQDKSVQELTVLKEQQSKLIESIESLTKAVSLTTNKNPVGISPGIPAQTGNAGKKEDAPNALAPDEKDAASGSGESPTDKSGLSGETKKEEDKKSEDKKEDKKEETKKEDEDKKEETKKEHEKEEEDKKDKMKMDEDKKEDDKKDETKKTLEGNYRGEIEKSSHSGSSIIEKMSGKDEGTEMVTADIVKRNTINAILGGEFGQINEMIQTPFLKSLPTVGGNK